MLETHRLDREIIAACRRVRRPVTASEIASNLAGHLPDAPHARTVERHLMGLAELGIVERTAEIRDDRATAVWALRKFSEMTETVYE